MILRLTALMACLAAPVAAQDRLPDALSGSAMDGTVVFGFEQTGCAAATWVEQSAPGGGQSATRVSFNFADLDPGTHQLNRFAGDGLAQIVLSARGGSNGFPYEASMDSADRRLRAAWSDAGATCDGQGCTRATTTRQVTLYVEGPMAADRAEPVIAELRSLAVSCRSANQ